jgi:saccharopine dehydrogenase-like NADP-dependent oxidoreductase
MDPVIKCRSKKMKAILLGCGEMGEEAFRDLYEFGHFDELLIGTRSVSKAQLVVNSLKPNLTKISIHEIDASDTDSMANLMEGCTVAVNCIGPNYKYELPIAFAAIKAKVNLVDINDEYEITPQMYQLHDEAVRENILIIIGLGGCPGIDNVLVRSAANQLDEVDEIHTAWVMSGADPGGLALSYHLLYSLSGKALTVQDGKIVEVQSFVDGKEKLKFPEPIGEVDVYHIGHPEPLTLFRAFAGAKYIDNKATFIPPEINEQIVELGKIVLTGIDPIRINGYEIDTFDFAASYLNKRCKSLKNIPLEAALRVEVNGRKKSKKKKITFSSVGRLGRATGIPASIGAIMISQNKIEKKGVYAPELCIDPNDFLYEILDRRNIAQLNGWVEE